jgi:hypothetical protein
VCDYDAISAPLRRGEHHAMKVALYTLIIPRRGDAANIAQNPASRWLRLK